jgi:hypothetical protein
MSDEELVITEENFSQYFRDVRQATPEKGEVMVCYCSTAEFVAGPEKRHMIQLIQLEGKIEAASQVMRKLLFASELDAYRVPKAMIQDLLEGMTEDEVWEKPYKYTVEIFYYTKPEYVPKDDPHWTIIQIVNLDKFLESKQPDTEEKPPEGTPSQE